MSLNRQVLPFRLLVSAIVALIYVVIATGAAHHHSIPITWAAPSPTDVEGFYLMKCGGVLLAVPLMWCFGLFDHRT